MGYVHTVEERAACGVTYQEREHFRSGDRSKIRDSRIAIQIGKSAKELEVLWLTAQTIPETIERSHS